MKRKSNYYNLIRVTSAVLVSFLIATVIIFCVADDPMYSINKFFLGPLSSKRNFFNVIENMIPLVFTGLAINIMHKSGLFSMAADSSFYFSAVMASCIAIAMPIPNIAHQIAIILVAALVGGLLGMIPAWIKKVTGANELVISLMMNYVTFNLGYWIIKTFFLDPENGAFSVKFLPTASLGKLIKGTSMHYGIFIMIGGVLLMWLLLDKSKYGKQLKITGENIRFAKYSGIKVPFVIMASQFIGGALAGVGGAVELIGRNTKFIWNTPVNYVWDGILINLLANTKPLLIPVSAFFISYIRVGALIMSRGGGVETEIVSLIQAIVILLIASERFLYKMKKKREEKEALENQRIEETVVSQAA